MVNTWDFLWGFEYGHRKDVYSTKNQWDFHGQYDGFSKNGHAVPWKTYGSDHGYPWNNHGFPIRLPCYFLWIFHGLPMGLLWIYSRGF